MSRQEREESGNSLSFLDVIACAFGAIVLLVLILPIGQFAIPAPAVSAANLGLLLFDVETATTKTDDLQEAVALNQQILDDLNAQDLSAAEQVQRIQALIATIEEEKQRVTSRTESLEAATSLLQASTSEAQETKTIASEFGGIPIDSEYVVFVIDTSSSMQSLQRRVANLMNDLLNMYPDLKGIQMMTDQGTYVTGRRGWLRDTPQTRQALLRGFQTATWGSRSNPVNGIRKAVSDLYQEESNMALVVVGDDLAGGWSPNLIDFIDQKVAQGDNAQNQFRIHGILLPNDGLMTANACGFTKMMRAFTTQYDGAFVALENETRNRRQNWLERQLNRLSCVDEE